MFERVTSRTYTLLLIPHSPDEDVQITGPETEKVIEEIFEVAIGKRQANQRKIQ
ncbi:MAG: hypothetical protein WAX66_03950 [Patescibacteria group bacterium]